MKVSPVIVLVLTSLALLLPFVARPLFVDDHAHFAEALTLPGHWSNPYQDVPHMLGWKAHGSPGEANPPLYFYLIAAFTRAVGAQLWKAHLLIMAITILGVLAFYSLAKPYTSYPAWASLLWLTTPHVWLTANSLLIDSLVSPFMLIGLALWIKGWREKKSYCSLPGAIFLGLAPLVKYTGAIGLPLAAGWVIFEAREKFSWRWLFLGLPVGMFAGWMAWTHHLYGQSHFAAVAAVKMNFPSLPHWITLAVFAAATTPLMAIGAVAFLKRAPKSLKVPSWVLFGGIVSFGYISGYRPFQGYQLSVWTAVFAAWLLSITPEENKFWAEDGFLITWSMVGFAEIAFAIRWVCGRFLVMVSPAWVLLSVRTLERRCPDWLASRTFRMSVFGVLTFFSAGLAVSDMLEARSEQRAAAHAEAWRVQHAPTALAYYPEATLGGMSFYLPEAHWQATTPGQAPASGSIVFLPVRTLPPIFWPRLTKPVMLAQWEYRSAFPFRTLDAVGGSGYYGSIWGPLPYSFSMGPLDVYLVVQVG